MTLLLADGGGSFTARSDHATEGRPNEALLMLLDGDVDLDLVATNPEVSTVSVLINRSVP